MADDPNEQEALLVALDFSSCSMRALDMALRWRRSNAEVTALHVLDRALIQRIDTLGLAAAEAALARLREQAEASMATLLADRSTERIETMIVVGEPFVEIVKIANDLACDVIFIGMHGRDSDIAHLLFGGTAERVVRGANRPVVCVP